MPYFGPIIIVEDDKDDQEIFAAALQELNISNELLFFANSAEAYSFLLTTHKKPLLIVCDINLPAINGMEFKRQIDRNVYLRSKAIPFVFLSTASDEKFVKAAYLEYGVHGYFKKSDRMEDVKRTFAAMVEYWKLALHPSVYPN
jgi:CheY-like chemotaxis protein